MDAHPAPSAAVYRREALNIRVGKDVAWVSFHQYAPGSSGAFVDLPEATNEMRILEKDTKGWKIAGFCSFHRSVEHMASALVRVDQQAAVLWMNSAAEQELRTNDGIAIRAGRLRAADRVADQRLQAAIRWAGPIDETHYDLPRHGTLPIVLAGGGGERANVCWVIAHNNQILVAINDRTMTGERLAAAAAVYNITPGPGAPRRADRRRPRPRRCRRPVGGQRQHGADASPAHVREDRRPEPAGPRPRPPQRRVAAWVNR